VYDPRVQGGARAGVGLAAAAVAVALAACSGASAPPPGTAALGGAGGTAAVTAEPRSGVTSRAGLPGAAEARCLPVVAGACGCVYDCATGVPAGSDFWTVRHPFWGDKPLRARVDRWCAGSECTEAFMAEIVCDGICAPKPADATCHFEGDLCVGHSTAEPR
jgi:hypothetical protein